MRVNAAVFSHSRAVSGKVTDLLIGGLVRRLQEERANLGLQFFLHYIPHLPCSFVGRYVCDDRPRLRIEPKGTFLVSFTPESFA